MYLISIILSLLMSVRKAHFIYQIRTEGSEIDKIQFSKCIDILIINIFYNIYYTIIKYLL